ncbi:MAG TPA: DUF5665 domain-containing protein [Candidatus Saccharimonadales bacterium]|nr:DUF5665 domain-containing protein [Candidatus Saccharimonadales bacterium]
MAKEDAKKSIIDKVKEDNERGARQNLIEELFYDFNRNRVQIFKMNFFRGIFFGFGSVLGGTIVVALLIWLLSFLAGVFPPLGDFFNGISNTVES